MNFLHFFRDKIKSNREQNENQVGSNLESTNLPSDEGILIPNSVDAKYDVPVDNLHKIFEEEIKDFFPKTGHWWSSCYSKPGEVNYANLPCHLRDNGWMSKLFSKKLREKGKFIPQYKVRKLMEGSENFNKLRHDYELEIVKFQIDWIVGGGERWLIPEGYDDLSMMVVSDVENFIRSGVVKTLNAIGMNGEVIEEGLEQNPGWRIYGIKQGFDNIFQQYIPFIGSPEPANEEHKQNWLACREYEYYQKHKASVDKYGALTDNMKMSADEYSERFKTLEHQNTERREFLENWEKIAQWEKSFGHRNDIDDSTKLDNEEPLTVNK